MVYLGRAAPKLGPQLELCRRHPALCLDNLARRFEPRPRSFFASSPLDRSAMFGVFGRQPPKASAREVALETENSALKAEVAALRRRLGEDNDEQASTDDKSPASKAVTPKTAKPRAETQAATGTKRARDGDGDERPKKSYQQRQYEKKLAKMPAWERALHEGKTEFPRFTVPEPNAPEEPIDHDDDESKAFAAKIKDDIRKSKENFQKRWEATASLRPFCHKDLAADDEATRRDARVWYQSLKNDYLANECRALGLAYGGNKSELYKRIAGWARYGRKRPWHDGICEIRTFCGDSAFYCVSTDEFPRVEATFWDKSVFSEWSCTEEEPYGGMLVKGDD